MTRKKKWRDLPPVLRVVLVVAAGVQLALISIAHADISLREDEQIRGSKRKWRLISLINFVGPVLYFRRGRIRT